MCCKCRFILLYLFNYHTLSNSVILINVVQNNLLQNNCFTLTLNHCKRNFISLFSDSSSKKSNNRKMDLLHWGSVSCRELRVCDLIYSFNVIREHEYTYFLFYYSRIDVKSAREIIFGERFANQNTVV